MSSIQSPPYSVSCEALEAGALGVSFSLLLLLRVPFEGLWGGGFVVVVVVLAAGSRLGDVFGFGGIFVGVIIVFVSYFLFFGSLGTGFPAGLVFRGTGGFFTVVPIFFAFILSNLAFSSASAFAIMPASMRA